VDYGRGEADRRFPGVYAVVDGRVDEPLCFHPNGLSLVVPPNPDGILDSDVVVKQRVVSNPQDGDQLSE